MLCTAQPQHIYYILSAVVAVTTPGTPGGCAGQTSYPQAAFRTMLCKYCLKVQLTHIQYTPDSCAQLAALIWNHRWLLALRTQALADCMCLQQAGIH